MPHRVICTVEQAPDYAALVHSRLMMERMIEFAVHSVVEEIDDAGVTYETRAEDVVPEFPWAVAWRARAAVWMMRNRRDLESALV